MESASDPERTCIGCRGKEPKRALVRLLRAPDGRVLVDEAGTSAGRGAYVHPLDACIRRALAPATLGRALRRSVGAEELDRLRADIERVAKT